MANPWDGATYENGDLAPGARGDELTCAGKKGTREIWFRHGDGTTWSTPTLAGTVPEGKSKACNVHQKPDGSILTTNGIDWARVSKKYGAAGSWEDA